MSNAMTPAERVDAIVAFVEAEVSVGGGDFSTAMTRLAAVVPDATGDDIKLALETIAARQDEKAAQLEAERDIWRQVKEVGGPDMPADRPVGEWAQELVVAGDPRGQKILDLLSDPRLPEFIEVEREINPVDLASDLHSAQKMFVDWFLGQVRWNRERNAELSIELEDGMEDIDLPTKSLNQLLEFLPTSVHNLEILATVVEQMERRSDVRDLALRYAAALPAGVDGRVALRAFANAIMLVQERRPGELQFGPIAPATHSSGDDGGAES